MAEDTDFFLARDFSEALRKIRERTPARIFLGRAGAAYRTGAQLDLREAHAAARDAVRAEFNLETAFSAEFLKWWNLFEVSTEARSKEEYLLRPDLGRRFQEKSGQEIAKRCSRGADIQIAIGDGLSVTAVSAQVPPLLPRRNSQCNRRIARAESGRAVDRRAPGPGHGGKFVRVYGLPAQHGANGCEPEPHLEYSFARIKSADRGGPHSESCGANDGAAGQRIWDTGTIDGGPFSSSHSVIRLAPPLTRSERACARRRSRRRE